MWHLISSTRERPVRGIHIFEDDAEVYGPMSLHAAAE
jgi:hypothetical protein